MKRYFLYTFLLIFIVGFLVWPEIGLVEFDLEEIIENSEKVSLKEKDVQNILKSLTQEFKYKWIDLTAGLADFKIEEQVVLVIIPEAVKIEAMNYLFIQVPKKIGEDLIKGIIKVARLILAEDPSILLEEIEKITVQEAKEYLIDWLFQKEIKVNSGNLKVSYPAYSGGWENVTFPYIIAYRALTPTRGEVGVNVYSPDFIKTPKPSPRYQWEGGIEELPPFIIKISGEVDKNKISHYLYNWTEGPNINIVFDEPVPEFDFAEPGFFDKLRARFNEMKIVLEKALEKIDIFFRGTAQITKNTTKSALSKIKSIFSNLNIFTATVAPSQPSFEDLESEERLTSLIEEMIEKEEKLEEELTETTLEPEAKTELTLAEIQEIIDDITEKIDIISQEIISLAGETQQVAEETSGETLEEVEEIAEKEKKQEEAGQEIKEEETLRRVIRGGGGSPTLSYCQKPTDVQLSRDKIIINEIAWMGTGNSANDEWVELKNVTDSQVNLSGWQLLDKGEQIKIILSSDNIIPAEGFYLLERTDDNSVPNITADVIYSGALNNSNEGLYLFDGDCQLQDEVMADPDWEAGNKEEKRSMERSDDLSWHTYSGEGKDGIAGTPKAENSRPTEEEPTEKPEEEPEEERPFEDIPPEVIFNIEPTQTSLSFTIYWTATDSLGSVTPSGIDMFYLKYDTPSIETTSPSTGEAIALWYQNDNEEWQDWTKGEVLEFGAQKDDLYVLGKDEHTYYFQIRVKDKAGNESNWEEASTKISLPKTVLISEVQIADNEFVELYNFGEQDIDISEWYFSYFSSERDWNEPWRSKKFLDETTILAGNYYLVGLKGYPEENGNPSADWQPYSSSQLSNEAGALAVFPWDPKAKTSEEAEEERIDAVGWGDIVVKEGDSVSVSSVGKSLTRKQDSETQEYQDTNNNQDDFEIKDLSPINSKGEVFSLPSYSEAPWPMFRHDAQNTGRSLFVGPGISAEPEVQVLVEGEDFSPVSIDKNGTFYFTARIDGKEGLYAFYFNGIQKWYYETPLSSNLPLIGPDGIIYILVPIDKILIAINPGGTLKWEKSLSDIMPQGNLIMNNSKTIYFLANTSEPESPSKLIALNSINKEIIWTYEAEKSFGSTQSPAIGPDNTIYFGQNDVLYAINSDGTEKWKRVFLSDYEWSRGNPIVSTLSIGDDGTIYVLVGAEKDWSSMTNAGLESCFHSISPENQEIWESPKCSIDQSVWTGPLTISSYGNIYFARNYAYWFPTVELFGIDSQGNNLENWPFDFKIQGAYKVLLVDNKEIIYVLCRNIIKSFNQQGIENWSLSLGNESNLLNSFSLSGDGTLFVAGRQNLFIIK